MQIEPEGVNSLAKPSSNNYREDIANAEHEFMQ